jgi:lysozyme
MSKYKISYACTEIVKQFEGFRRDAYLCPAKKWTIGYGSTIYEDGSSIRAGDGITHEKAEYLLITHIQREVLPVLDKIEGLNQNQVDALASFIFNIGNSAFKKSTIYRLLKEGKFDEASEQFKRWNKSNQIILKGLVARREAEQKLFDKEFK